MSNINNLTSKIIDEANAKRDEILGSAREEEAKIIDKKVSEARKMEEDIINKANREALTMKDRIISNAELTVRNNKLAAKQVVISKVFSRALESLNGISNEEFAAFMKSRLSSMELCGEYNLIIGKNTNQALAAEIVEDMNLTFSGSGRAVQINLVGEPGNFQGGFILEKNGIEINNTFEALISSMRDDLEYEVTKALFS
jgi:V/A-type H+-transporting ATPase subunit E